MSLEKGYSEIEISCSLECQAYFSILLQRSLRRQLQLWHTKLCSSFSVIAKYCQAFVEGLQDERD